MIKMEYARFWFILVLCALVCAGFAATAYAAAGDAAAITVTPQNPEMAVGQNMTFTAEGSDADGAPVPIRDPHWECDPRYGTITPNPDNPSQVTYTATAEGNGYVLCYQGKPSEGGVNGSTDIKQSITINPSTYLARIEVTPNNVSMTVGQQKLFTATGYDQNGNVYQIDPIYSTNGGGEIDKNGNYTATVPGDFSVTASVTGSNVLGQGSVTIEPGTYLARIDVTPANVSMMVGQQKLFTATGYDQNGNVYQIDPIYSTDGGGTVDKNGNYTAAVPGDFSVTASVTGSNVQGQGSVTIEPGTYLARIDVTPANVSMMVGQQKLFTATGYDQNGDIIPIQPLFSSDGGTVDGEGNYQAASPGKHTITASVEGSEVSGSAAVYVIDESMLAALRNAIADASAAALQFGVGLLTVLIWLSSAIIY